jgi:serine O-acetyltransferase
MFDRIREDVRCVFDRDPAARNSFEVLTTYPGVHAMLFHRLCHRLWNIGFKWPARFLSSIARWLTGIEIHPAARIGRRFFIDHGMGVVIGETAEIGDDCTLYHGVTLGGTAWEKGKRHPTLGNGVIIGAGAKVLGPVHVGDGGRIGSNAVVMKDVPAGATVIGVPGHIARRHKKADEKKRREFAEKIGFDAYAAAGDMPDPVVQSINALLDHIHALDARVEMLTNELEKLGAEVDASPLPELGAYEIDSIENVRESEDNKREESAAPKKPDNN